MNKAIKNNITNLYQKFFTPPEKLQSEYLRNFALNNYIFVYMFFAHSTFMPVYYLLGNRSSLIDNILLLIIDIICIILNQQGKTRISSSILILGIAYHAFFSNYNLGWDAGFSYYFLTLILYTFILKENFILKVIFSTIIIGLFIFSYLYRHQYSVQYPDTIIPIGLLYILNVGANFITLSFLAIYFNVITDRSEKRIIEAKDKALEGTRAKTSFLANMSHEIRTPMNAVIGMINLSLLTDSNKEKSEYLFIAKESADHLLTVINDILDFSKIEVKKLTLVIENFDLYKLMHNTVHAMSPISIEKNLAINLTIKKDVPQFIKGDLSRIRQILINFISNAIKFTKEGEINITVFRNTNAEIKAENGKLLLSFSVQDTGIGIEKNQLTRIFDSFTQADDEDVRRQKGTGLGLAISKQLVEMMNGVIHTESKIAEGSTFTFTIPLEPGTQIGSPEIIQSPEKELRTLHVLLAEDNAVNQKLAKLYLEKMGHTFHVAENGNEVLMLLKETHFDIILMDIEMPQMNGLEATKKIRDGEAGNSNSRIPIIAMSAHVITDLRELTRKTGMDDFISKPVSLRDMASKLKETVEKHKMN